MRFMLLSPLAAVCMFVTGFAGSAYSQGSDTTTARSRNPDLHLKGDSVRIFQPDADFVEVFREIVQGSKIEGKTGCSLTIELKEDLPIATTVERDITNCKHIIAYGYSRSKPPVSRKKNDSEQRR